MQPSRRPADGRYGDNPFRLYKHTPVPGHPQAVAGSTSRRSTCAASRRWASTSRLHDLRFEEDNWEAPTLGAWGVGWQVMLDGMEITQFTYFQQAGGLDLEPISCEITYGLERITMFLGLEKSIYDIRWVPDGVTYHQVRRQDEFEFSKYNFEVADVAFLRAQLDGYEREARRCLEAGIVLPAYECALKCSHLFNLLDARGAVSVTERVGLMKRVRDLAIGCAEGYLASRERLGFPLPPETGLGRRGGGP